MTIKVKPQIHTDYVYEYTCDICHASAKVSLGFETWSEKFTSEEVADQINWKHFSGKNFSLCPECLKKLGG